MPLTKLQFRPGVNRDVTSYTNEGGWFDCEKVRFRLGFPEKIGGWTRTSNNSFLGTCRSIHPFVALDGSSYIGVGTHLKFYISEGGAYYDITPIRLTTAAGAATFSVPVDTLSAGISASDATIPLTSVTGFPSAGRIKIDSEQITYSAISGSSLVGCTRGVGGTTAATHSSAADVFCSTVTVTVINHGARQGDFVTFSAAASLGGNITAAILNQEYEILSVEDSDTFTIDARTVSTLASILTAGVLNPTYVFSNASDTGSGGASTVAEFQVNTGLDTTVQGTGWGAGSWSRGSWGSGSSLLVSGETLRLWSQDNYGEDLVFGIRDGGIFYWDKSTSSSPFARGVALSDLAGADATTPTVARKVLVSNRDRHILAFGCDPETDIGTQDPLLIRFSSQESPTTWTTLPTNSAGELRLSTGSKIITAIETRQQVLVFTDVSVNALQYLGPPYTFGIAQLSDNTTICGPNSAIAVDDNVFWMGIDNFYVYTGQVNVLPCPVESYIFNDFNKAQAEKSFATLNSSFSEVWWFYCSSSSSEIDRYTVFNYKENAWYYGQLVRTAWVDRGILPYPVAAASDGRLYYHENGLDDGTTEPASAITSYIKSSDLAIGAGDHFVFLNRLLPDVTFDASTAVSPAVDLVLESRNFPGQSYQQTESSTTTRSATVPVEQFTNQVNLRLRGRSFALKVQSTAAGVQWRLGSPRVEVRPDGRR